MGMKEDVLALADELGAFEDGDCEECGLYGQPECKGHLSCMEIMARYAARKMREAVERDGEGATTASAYDLLGDDDREALAWMREMGGVNALSRGFQDADNRRIELCSSLGIDLETGWADAMVAMRRRLMPEGMEWLLEVWPKWSNGEYCKFGDWWTAAKYGEHEPKQLRRLVFCTPEQLREWEQDEGDNFGYEWDFMRPSDTTYRPDKAEPPAPKVLDADGEEIRVGDTVWTDYGDGPWTVTNITTNHAWHVYGESDELGSLDMPPSTLTHRAPVFAADGKPIREGETVWHVGNGVEFTVIGLPNPGEYQSVKLRLDGGASTGLDPDLLTHQRPVLDADGNRIEPAMDVWWICEGDERGAHAEKLHVESIGEDGLVTCDPFNGGTWVELEPSELYVNRPVLDADGVPIKKGDTVWNATTSARPLTVREIERSDDPDEPEDIVWCGERAANGFKVWRIADQLAHTKPEIDTWERIEEDATKNPFDYCKDVGHRLDTCENAERFKSRDLVRRCRELAERGA